MGSWFEGVEAAAFRQVENGYVFSAPWLAGPSRRYLPPSLRLHAIGEPSGTGLKVEERTGTMQPDLLGKDRYVGCTDPACDH